MEEEIALAIEQIKEELQKLGTNQENNEGASTSNENILDNPEEIERLLSEMLSSQDTYDSNQPTCNEMPDRNNDKSCASTTDNSASVSFGGALEEELNQQFSMEYFDVDDFIEQELINYCEEPEMPSGVANVTTDPGENREIGACSASYAFEPVDNLSTEQMSIMDLLEELSELIDLNYVDPSDIPPTADEVPAAKPKENDNEEMEMGGAQVEAAPVEIIEAEIVHAQWIQGEGTEAQWIQGEGAQAQWIEAEWIQVEGLEAGEIQAEEAEIQREEAGAAEVRIDETQARGVQIEEPQTGVEIQEGQAEVAQQAKDITEENPLAWPSTSSQPPRVRYPVLKSKRKLNFDDDSYPQPHKFLKPLSGERVMAECVGISAIYGENNGVPAESSASSSGICTPSSNKEDEEKEENKEEKKEDTPAGDQATKLCDEFNKYLDL